MINRTWCILWKMENFYDITFSLPCFPSTACSSMNFMRGSLYITHCKMQLTKHVFPKFLRPGFKSSILKEKTGKNSEKSDRSKIVYSFFDFPAKENLHDVDGWNMITLPSVSSPFLLGRPQEYYLCRNTQSNVFKK